MDLLTTTPDTIGSRLRLSLVTHPVPLEKLRPEWQQLLEASASAEPMLSPDWLLTWWRVYGQGRSLCVGLFWDGNELVGLAPLVKRRFWYRPGIPFRRLEVLGADVDEHDGVCSEYLNIIVRTGWEDQVAGSLAEELAAGAFGGWDELVLRAMDGTGPMPRLITKALRQVGLTAEMSSTRETSYIPLPASWNEYLGALTKKRRYGVTRALRDLETWSGTPIELRCAATSEELAHGKEILIRLHEARWESAGSGGGRGAFHSPRFTAFHDALMPILFQNHQLELLWIEVQGRPIAAMYNLIANDKVYFYQSGRELDVPKGQRPGIALMALAIQRAIERSQREFDFLGGDELYKSQLALGTRPLVQVRAVRPCWIESVRRLADCGIRGLRSLRHRLRGTFAPAKTQARATAVNAD